MMDRYWTLDEQRQILDEHRARQETLDAQIEAELEAERRRICPGCHGTGMSPYPDDGGSCPHCFGGSIH